MDELMTNLKFKIKKNSLKTVALTMCLVMYNTSIGGFPDHQSTTLYEAKTGDKRVVRCLVEERYLLMTPNIRQKDGGGRRRKIRRYYRRHASIRMPCRQANQPKLKFKKLRQRTS